MRSWLETASDHFTARHSEIDVEFVHGVLDQLEATRARLADLMDEQPEGVAVVLHETEAQLTLARPTLPLRRALTAKSGRRFVAGGLSGLDIHVLSPPPLAERASGAEGSAEMLGLTPAALYARLAVGWASPRLPPPARVGTMVRAWRWAWLVEGIGAWASGQTALARPAIHRRLLEGPEPSFPPALADAPLLGGTVVDLIAREEGGRAAVDFAIELPAGPRAGLVDAFRGRSLAHSESAWRAHLARLADAETGR